MIHSEQRGPVTLVTLDRQPRRNAVNLEALDDLLRVLGELGDTRVVVLTGAGDHFCSGADLTGVEDDRFRLQLAAVLRALRDLPIATVAAVHGAAMGAGTQLALACDLRVAAPDARFGIPAARLGLMVDQWTVQRVAMLCGQGPASALLLAADTISAADATSIGLVQRIGDLDAALGWADEIAALAPLTIAGHKLALNSLEPGPVGPGGPAGVGADPMRADVAAVEAASARAWASEDLQEGLVAFREGRRPIFRGR
jgi:enoyl-CoA hydratase